MLSGARGHVLTTCLGLVDRRDATHQAPSRLSPWSQSQASVDCGRITSVLIVREESPDHFAAQLDARLSAFNEDHAGPRRNEELAPTIRAPSLSLSRPTAEPDSGFGLSERPRTRSDALEAPSPALRKGSSRQGTVAADVLPAAAARIPARAVVGRAIRYNRGRDVFSGHKPTVPWRRSLPSG